MTKEEILRIHTDVLNSALKDQNSRRWKNYTRTITCSCGPMVPG